MVCLDDALVLGKDNRISNSQISEHVAEKIYQNPFFKINTFNKKHMITRIKHNCQQLNFALNVTFQN